MELTKGQKFGKWTIIEQLPKGDFQHTPYLCICECGKKKAVDGTSLTSGNSRSCGCLAREEARQRLRTKPYLAVYNLLRRSPHPVSISYEEFLTFTKIRECFYCLAPIEWQEFASNKTGMNGYHLDRIDNNRGYDVDNVVVCCTRCNFTRADRFTHSEFVEIGKTIQNFQHCWISTYSGKKFHLLAPQTEEICIEDIAHALSQVTRFTGHTKWFYSVAQHSVYCSTLVPPQFALEALLHDASESYICDMSRPLKHFTPCGAEYLKVEKVIEHAIALKFSLPLTMSPCVKDADNMMLYAEKEQLMPPREWDTRWGETGAAKIKIRSWAPEFAEQAYLDRFQQLMGGKLPCL